MSSELATILIWITGIAVFVLVACLWFVGTIGVYLRQRSSEDKLTERLHESVIDDADKSKTLRLWHNGKIGSVDVERSRGAFSILRAIDGARRNIGWEGSLFTFICMVLGSILLACTITYGLTENAALALGWILAIPGAIYFLSAKRAVKHDQIFEQQFAEALGLAARSLRAGHPLLSAFHVIVDEMEPPVSDVFTEIVQQQALGKTLEEAIQTAADKTTSPDMKLFAAATVIQLRSGGNLADMMDRLVHVIRDRIRLQRRVRVLTAQTQLSKRILIAVPIGLLFLLATTKPDYLAPMFDTAVGRNLLITAGVLLVVGSWVMNKIATLKY